MAFETAIIRQAVSTSAAPATQDFTSSGFGTPQAAIFVVQSATADLNAKAHCLFSMGFTDGTRDKCIGGDSTDGPSTSECDTVWDDGALLRVIAAGTPTESGKASFNSWITDGVRIDIDTTFAGAYLVTCILIKGCSDVYVGDFTTGTSTSTVDITDPGFEPKGVFLISGNLTADGTTTDFMTSIGFAANGSGGVQNACYFRRSLDAQGTTQGIAGCRDDSCVADIDGNWTGLGHLQDFDSSGFTFDPSDNAFPADVKVGYLAFACDEDVWVGDIASAATDTTDASYTEPGFQPDNLFVIGTNTHTINATDQSGHEPASFSVGAVNVDAQEFANAIRDRDANGAGDSSTRSVSGRTVWTFNNTNSSAHTEADLDSWDASGFTLHWYNVTGTTLCVAMAVEQPSAAPTNSLFPARRAAIFGGGRAFSPVGYYRLGQSYPRDMARAPYPIMQRARLVEEGTPGQPVDDTARPHLPLLGVG